ncbi:RAI1-domain-containing protein [Vararia minispora EC-137]|uniref:RAI1-domain-containing protein n=1 Tax=Vararia minispora EC-137 TaxID=1314806 RepID=A0ACB8QSA8_9AGAM|nr:RAI1-domain-containing protein [Vararia minispora EC-137]
MCLKITSSLLNSQRNARTRGRCQTTRPLRQFNDSALRYFVDPPRRANLRYGYERWIRRPDERGRLDSLLRAYVRVLDKPPPDVGSLSAGVVSWRGIMTKILTAPYEERDGWELNVMELNGTLYLEEHLTNVQLLEKNDMKPQHHLQSYYGYAFESWCTADAPDARPGWGGDVNTNVQWCSVVKTRLGDTRIVIGGEVDCVRGGYSGANDSMVELKTSMSIRGPQDEARFEKKLLKFYIQSFLLGVPEIVVGFRTPKGELTALQTFKTMQIPRMVRGKPGTWNPQICLAWGDQFLTWLRAHVGRGDATEVPAVWRVSFVPRTGVKLVRLDETGVSDVVNGDDRYGFLPTWYWERAREALTAPSQPGT